MDRELLKMEFFKIFSCLIAATLFTGCEMETPGEQSEAKAAIQTSEVLYLADNMEITSIDSTITVDYLMGKFVPEKHEDFVKVDAKYASKEGFYLRKESYEAFQKMNSAASKDGVRLRIVSATRPFAHQKKIWEDKWNGRRKVDNQDLSATAKDPSKSALRGLE